MKQIHKSDLTGDRGIALIHTIVGDMGLVWNARPFEAGIDGHIEIRDDVTGEVGNHLVSVQSKAVDGNFRGETDEVCDFYCEERDIDYWMGGNVPVILVLSRPRTKEAYWVDVKRYFADPARRQSRKVRFNRRLDRFDASTRSALIELAVPADGGIYYATRPIQETLVSNMVSLTFGTDAVYTAPALVRSEAELDRALEDTVPHAGRWTLWEDQVLSFEDLSDRAFAQVVERGSVERHPLDEWAESKDAEKRRFFAQLMYRFLKGHLAQYDITFDYRSRLFYFFPNDGLKSRAWAYQSTKEHSSREVFKRYTGSDGRTTFCRHSAFGAMFRRHEGSWFLEIEPTYYYTSDGTHFHKRTPEYLKKIKLIENNRAVLGQLRMWSDVLSRNEGMFAQEDAPLTFGPLLEFESPFGFAESEWRSDDESIDDEMGGLFD